MMSKVQIILGGNSMFRCNDWCSNFLGSDYTWWSSEFWIVCFIGMIIMLCSFMFFFVYAICRWKSNTIGACLTDQKMNGFNFTSSTITANDILDKRYALGEINKEEYDEMKENLKVT